MVIRWKHFRGRPIKEICERKEINENICARTFSVHKEYSLNDYITIRLEELEHLYTKEYEKQDEYDKEYSYKIEGEFYDYEWVIRIYVEDVDEITSSEYNIEKYNEFFIRLGFLPWTTTKYGFIGWEETLTPSIEERFEEVLNKLKTWVNNNYDFQFLEPDIA
ncbi:MAG: hypothetical protein ACW980_12860, partial [Promethearchaeota archaeon]